MLFLSSYRNGWKECIVRHRNGSQFKVYILPGCEINIKLHSYKIWYDMIWYDMIWYDIWYDMIWHRIVTSYDMIWYRIVWDRITYIWYHTTWVRFVLGTICPGYELSWVRVVLGMSCLGYELSWVRVVLGTSWLGYELSWVRIVQIPSWCTTALDLKTFDNRQLYTWLSTDVDFYNFTGLFWI